MRRLHVALAAIVVAASNPVVAVARSDAPDAKAAVAMRNGADAAACDRGALAACDRAAVAMRDRASFEADIATRERAAPATRDKADIVMRDEAALGTGDEAALGTRERADIAMRDEAGFAMRDRADIVTRDEAALGTRERADIATRDDAALAMRDRADIATRDEDAFKTRDRADIATRDGAALATREGGDIVTRDKATIVTRDKAALARRDNAAVALRDNAAVAGRTLAPKAASRAKAAVTSRSPKPSPRPDYLARPAVADFIDGLVADGRFGRATLMGLLGDARYSDTSVRLMTPAVTSAARRDWNAYRARFVEPVRLAAGLAFWDDNARWLAKAERDFGVPPEVVVGILGCETVYGRNTGSFRVLDTLTTLSFDYPGAARDRSPFFREQLVDALTMDRDGAIDLTTLRGSYAGAIGMPQFMPGSIRRYAIDYDGDGRIDLVDSPADVIGSVANFLAGHGWVRGLAPRISLSSSIVDDPLRAARVQAMVDAGSEPSLDFARFADAGFVADALPPEAKLALIDLPAGTDATGAPLTLYLAGTQNFHVVTRYNRSYFYALSVIELGEAIKALRDARQALSATGR